MIASIDNGDNYYDVTENNKTIMLTAATTEIMIEMKK